MELHQRQKGFLEIKRNIAMEKTRLQQVSPPHCTGHYENSITFITTNPQIHAFLETKVAISSASTLGRKRKSNETHRTEGTDAKTQKPSSIRVSPRISKQHQPSASTNNTEKGYLVNEQTRITRRSSGEGMKMPSVVRIKLKGKECREQTENSDSDFERPNIEVGEGSRGRKKHVKPKKAEKEAKQPRKVVGIRTRTSPMILQQTVSDLNDKQQKAVKEMGLDCFIGMKVDGIPSKLGFFVVNNLDTHSMQLRLEGGSIVINEMTIHEVLKVPIGGLDLTTMDSTDEGVELAAIWKKQYKKESPRPTDVMKKIQSTTDAVISNQLLYVESTIWNNDQIGTSEALLQKWNMIEFRNRQQSAIKGGGFQRAMIRGPVQPSNKSHENTTPMPEKDSKEDEESVKKGYIMELNEMFAILMRTKVDANTVIEKAKERFPSESIFERYEDELAILFNETGFRGSGKNKQPTTLVGCSHSSKKNQKSDPDEKHDVLCTPTKLNFDQMESLDALSPLSPYWYSQTTYGLIDAKIQEKSVGKVRTYEHDVSTDQHPAEFAEPVTGDDARELQMVVSNIHELEPMPISQYGPDIPIPSFNLGISQTTDVVEKNQTKKGKEVARDNEAPAKTTRRELKVLD
ncbi:hypothetical protein L6452_35135 [Arctium lappa]|uniref:Uncharacterized protein n=1 Tax=Arctium lappa TaxID=4217 RepID=A0ACB8YJB8_ARCLA|nr:hypothetical protein L6452_35135 [Arctium lappa]